MEHPTFSSVAPAPPPKAECVSAPYGYLIVFERAKPGGGLCAQYEEISIRRKGGEAAARHAAALTPGFARVISVTPIAAEDAPPKRKSRTTVASVTAPAEASGSDCAVSTAGYSMTSEQADAGWHAVRGVRTVAAELAAMAKRRKELLVQMVENLQTAKSLMPVGGAEQSSIGRILARIDRLGELINMEEFESWQITVDRTMDEVWRRLS